MKRFISAALALLMLLAAATACADSGNGEGTDVVTTAAAEQSETDLPVETKVIADVPDSDFNGHVFRVLTRGKSSATWYSKDIYSENISGDLISDAVFERNKKMEEKYKFVVEEVGSDKPAEDGKIAVASNLDTYDMFCFKIKDDMTSLIIQGYLYDLNQVDILDLDKPYYDQNSRREFSIDNRLFLVTGDLLTMDNDATRCSLFNKDLFTELSIAQEIGGTLYEKVADQTWTLDVMKQCAQLATSDLNGDGVRDLTDRYGMVSEQFNALAFTNAAGVRLYEKDSEDIPYFTGTDSRTLTILSDVITMLNGDYCRHYSNAYNEAIPQFQNGLVLFYPAQLADVPLLRAMDFDFGIVPLPKLTKEQDKYYSPVTTYGSNCISIPASVKNVERAGIIIEVLSCESMYTVTPAYYDVSLKTRLVRDAESSACLDIILGSAMFELAYMWNLAGVYSAICTAFNDNKPSLSAAFKASDVMSKTTIQKYVDSIRTNYRF